MGMTLTCAVEEARLGENDEGARVAGENAAEEDVTQLPAGRHDDGGPEEGRTGDGINQDKQGEAPHSFGS